MKSNQFHNRYPIWSGLALVVVVGIGSILRRINQTPYLYYPDSYQNILIAQFLQEHRSVIGTLGQYGLYYPPNATWTHPIYPLFILLFARFGLSFIQAAQAMSLLLGILAIPITFALVYTVTESSWSALLSSFLVAISFNHVLWSGAILTESTATLFFLFLLFAVTRRKENIQIGNLQDYLIGILLGCAVLVRYEYSVIGLPLILYTLVLRNNSYLRLITIAAGFLVTVVIIMTSATPFSSLLAEITRQTRSLIDISIIIGGILLLFFILKKYNTPSYVRNSLRILFGCIVFICLYSLVQLYIPSLSLFRHNFYALQNFLRHDFLLALLALLGMPVLIEINPSLAVFVLSGLVSLSFVYSRVNSGMERYFTHLIPLLLIPAGFSVRFFGKLPKHVRNGSILFLFIFFGLQILITAQGLSIFGDPTWREKSYEFHSSELTQTLKIPSSAILIASLPEPYYIGTKISTQSIYDRKPFLDVQNIPDTTVVYIIDDIPMRKIFPNFSKFLHENLSDSIISSYTVHLPFHYVGEVYPETLPVLVYRIGLSELKDRVKNLK